MKLLARELKPQEENLFVEDFEVDRETVKKIEKRYRDFFRSFRLEKGFQKYRKVILYRPLYEKKGELYKFSGFYRVYFGYSESEFLELDLPARDKKKVEVEKLNGQTYYLINKGVISQEFKPVLLSDVIKTFNLKPVVINDLGNEGKVFFLFDHIKVLEIPATPYEVEGSYILPVRPRVNKDLTLIGFSIWTGYTGTRATHLNMELLRLVCTNGLVDVKGILGAVLFHKSEVSENLLKKTLKTFEDVSFDVNKLIHPMPQKEKEKILNSLAEAVKNRKRLLDLLKKEYRLLEEIRNNRPLVWDIVNLATGLATWGAGILKRDFRIYSKLQRTVSPLIFSAISKVNNYQKN